MSQSRAWSWRHHIIRSDLPATTRHVLLTISCFMNEVGDGCYPTQEQLAEATGLSERAVREHLAIAVERGWLKRTEHGFRGQKWRNHEYKACWPEPQDVDEGAERGAGPSDEGAERGSERCGTSFQKVRNQVPPTSPYTSPYTSPPSAQARGWEGDFNILWSGWDPKHLPSSRETAERIFAKLSEEDRAKVLAGSKHFQRAMRLRGKKAPMITFMRNRLFLDHHDEPEIDEKGRFVSRPGKSEWSAWLGDVRSRYGQSGVDSVVKTGFYRTDTRWPEGFPSASNVTKMATAVAESVSA